MQTIESVWCPLEANASNDTMKIITVEDGETQADALKRSGYPPDALVCGTARHWMR